MAFPSPQFPLGPAFLRDEERVTDTTATATNHHTTPTEGANWSDPSRAEPMRLITHNMLRSNVKGAAVGFPLKIEAEETETSEADFDAGRWHRR